MLISVFSQAYFYAYTYFDICKIGENLDMIEFERAKELAKKNKMSLLEVNEKAGLGKRTIYNWKNRKPGSLALSSVAKVLHTSVDYLSGSSDDPNPHQKETVSLDHEVPYSYHGYHVPEQYLDMVRELMERDIEERRARKNGRGQ